MELRIKFRKGKQRGFLDMVIARLSCGSLRGILQFGFDVDYSSLKSYYIERRLIPKGLFDNLCYAAKIDKSGLAVKEVEANWGQVKGGKKSKRRNKIKNGPAKNRT